MKVINTVDYVSVLREIVENGQEANMIVWGGSMSPFLIHNRDRVFFSAPQEGLKRGDIVFYQRTNGQYVMHRIFKVTNEGYYTVGDAQTAIEGPLQRDQIFALITHVERKGKMIGKGNFWWNFFAGPWLSLLHFRSRIMRMYRVFKP